MEYIQRLLDLKEKIDQSQLEILTESKFIDMALSVGFSCDQAQDIFNRSIEDKPMEWASTGNTESILIH